MAEKHNKIERPEGKLAKSYRLVYDISALPSGLTVDMFTKLADGGFIFYDSTKGNRPKLYNTGTAGSDFSVEMIDTEGAKMDETALDNFKARMEDEEFWRKELYKCKQSPLYYFTQYVSPNTKPTQDEIEEFLVKHGFGATDDSDEAANVSETIRKAREKFSEGITLQKLQDLKPVRDRMDEEYHAETMEIQKVIAEKYDLSADNEAGLTKKIITDIMKSSAKDAVDELRYYVIEKSGRWDKSLLRATDFDVLVRLWKLL